MKKLLTFCLTAALFVFICVSCSDNDIQTVEDIDVSDTRTTLVDDLPEYHVNGGGGKCCEVTCRRGACAAYTSPCNCTCLGRIPSCGGLTAGIAFNDNDFVTQIEDHAVYESYDNLVQYLHENQAPETAEAIDNIKNLLQSNGDVIWQGVHLSEYTDNFAVWANYYQDQSEEVQQILDDL